MIERFEGLLIAAGFEIVTCNEHGRMLFYELRDDEEPDSFEVSLDRDFVEDDPQNGLAFVRMAFERRHLY